MELSDVVYLILMGAFVVFGIFNDSKKKKKAIDTSTKPLNDDAKDMRDVFRDLLERTERKNPPPVPKKNSTKRKEPSREKRFKQSSDPMHGFESSMGLVTDFTKESSLKGYDFVDEGSTKVLEINNEIGYQHPILENLVEGDRQSEFKKAIIYSEIINRKY